MMMKIAFCISEEKKPAPLDSRFGRSAYFYILNSRSGEVLDKIPNSHRDDSQGAGIASVQLLADKDIRCIVAPQLGPKAAELCAKLGILLYHQGESSTLEEAWGLWMEDRLKLAEKPGKGGLRRG